MTIRFGAMLATIEEEEKNASVATGLRRSNGRKQEERAEGDAPSGAGPHIGANECQSEAARGDGREQASCGGDKKTSVLFDVASPREAHSAQCENKSGHPEGGTPRPEEMLNDDASLAEFAVATQNETNVKNDRKP